MRDCTPKEEEVYSLPDEVESVTKEDAVVPASSESPCIVRQYNESTITINFDASESGDDSMSSTDAYGLKRYLQYHQVQYHQRAFQSQVVRKTQHTMSLMKTLGMAPKVMTVMRTPKPPQTAVNA